MSVKSIGLACAYVIAADVNRSRVDELSAGVEPKVIAWRRDFHDHPELSNRETRTAKLVAEHLKRLGLEVQTGVAHTGVVGFLKGGRPGPTVALRAYMDALRAPGYLTESGVQDIVLDGLHEVLVEAYIGGAAAVIGLSVTRQGNQPG